MEIFIILGRSERAWTRQSIESAYKKNTAGFLSKWVIAGNDNTSLWRSNRQSI